MKKRAMVILRDHREKAGYEFPKYRVEITTLPVGDYSIKGFEQEIAIERKSLRDLVACLTVKREQQRFEKELFRAQGLEYFGLIVESTFSGIANGRGVKSKTSKTIALQRLMYLCIQYRFPIFFAEDRHYSKWLVQCLLEKYWAELNRVAKAVLGAIRNHQNPCYRQVQLPVKEEEKEVVLSTDVG